MSGDDAGIRQFRLDETGIARVLGPLESSILVALWELTARSPAASVSIGQVCAQLGSAANYKTVQTVMNRLVEKGVLVRTPLGRAYGYRAAQSRAELETRISRDVVEQLLAEYGDLAIVQFVAAMREVNPEHVALLSRLIMQEEEPQ